MAGKNTAIFGIFRDRLQVDRAIDEFRRAGFRPNDISVLLPDADSTKEFAHEKHTKAPEGAATGAGAGAVLGGTFGWLIGIGALAIPGLGPFIAAGPIMAALAGAGVGGAVGGLSGAMIGMGIPEYEAKRYEGILKNGGILVSVHSDNREWTDRAKKIFESLGAADVDSTGEASADIKTDNRGNVIVRDESKTDTKADTKADTTSGRVGTDGVRGPRPRFDTPPAGSGY